MVQQLFPERFVASTGSCPAVVIPQSIAPFEDLERTKAEEVGGDATDNGALLIYHTAIIHGVSLDSGGGSNTGPSTGRRHPQVMHGFGTQKLSHRRAQHLAAVRSARVRRLPGSFHLQFPAFLGDRVDHFSQVHRGTITELASKIAELMATIAMRSRATPGNDLVATEILCEHILFSTVVGWFETEKSRQNIGRRCNQYRFHNWRGFGKAENRIWDLTRFLRQIFLHR
mmetsp:Transcript_12649/g.22133  ORF Transcript_12649/g.22133 Transcript_12649/m.22133 type:complete len:228 (-) Transcript_12649:204-887(-)